MIFAWTYQERLSGRGGFFSKAWICSLQGTDGKKDLCKSRDKAPVGEHVPCSRDPEQIC